MNRQLVQPELRSRGACPPRALLAAPRGQLLTRDTPTNAWNISVRPGFPRGREKLHPGRARSPFYFGVRVKLLSLLLFVAISAGAATGDELFKAGLDAGRAGQFSQAAKAFEESLARLPASGTLLNLGIVEWRSGRVGEAIVSWERAAWLNPFDQEARNNLAFAREAAQVYPPELAWHEMASTWLPASDWAWLAGGSLWLALALVIFPGVLRVRKAAWQQALAALACGVFILSLAPNLGVWTRSSLGIVLEKKTVLRLTPTQEGEVVATLAAGEAARQIREHGGYVLIRTASGSGWVERRQFGRLSPAR